MVSGKPFTTVAYNENLALWDQATFGSTGWYNV